LKTLINSLWVGFAVSTLAPYPDLFRFIPSQIGLIDCSGLCGQETGVEFFMKVFLYYLQILRENLNKNCPRENMLFGDFRQ